MDMWAGGAFLFDTFISITDDSGTGKIIQVWISQSKETDWGHLEYHKFNGISPNHNAVKSFTLSLEAKYELRSFQYDIPDYIFVQAISSPP